MTEKPSLPLPFPRQPKDRRAAQIEADIWALLEEYYRIAPAARAAFFMHNLFANARARGLTDKALHDPHKVSESEPSEDDNDTI